ncbi:MAG: hypothetical protein IPG12_13140 [Saprospiraceae bacterium]|nr:hypothetical protein [Saprospiraceae bacterium]
MTKQILLWLNFIFSVSYLTGHIFDYFVIMSNWKYGNIELLINYRSFFKNADPGVFFRIIVPATVIISLISFIAYLRNDKKIIYILSVHFVLTIAAFLFTMFYFLPINNYLFWGNGINLEPVKTMALAKSWVLGENFRIIQGFLCVIASARALHLSYSKIA